MAKNNKNPEQGFFERFIPKGLRRTVAVATGFLAMSGIVRNTFFTGSDKQPTSEFVALGSIAVPALDRGVEELSGLDRYKEARNKLGAISRQSADRILEYASRPESGIKTYTRDRMASGFDLTDASYVPVTTVYDKPLVQIDRNFVDTDKNRNEVFKLRYVSGLDKDGDQIGTQVVYRTTEGQNTARALSVEDLQRVVDLPTTRLVSFSISTSRVSENLYTRPSGQVFRGCESELPKELGDCRPIKIIDPEELADRVDRVKRTIK